MFFPLHPKFHPKPLRLICRGPKLLLTCGRALGFGDLGVGAGEGLGWGGGIKGFSDRSEKDTTGYRNPKMAEVPTSRLEGIISSPPGGRRQESHH